MESERGRRARDLPADGRRKFRGEVLESSTLESNVIERSSRPAVLDGSVSVDLKSLDTGIDLRNDHLWSIYLEVEKGKDFDRAVLTDIRLDEVDWDRFQGKTGFNGTFLLHGTKKSVRGQAEIRKQGSKLRVAASFPVSLAEFGIAKPQYLGIGVKNEVEAKVSLLLSPESPAGGSK